ncbi:MAG: helix-hairpin-helix domain-containing protein [Chitinophagaceae bacterium]
MKAIVQYFQFSRKERVAAVALLVIGVTLFAVPWWLTSAKSQQQTITAPPPQIVQNNLPDATIPTDASAETEASPKNTLFYFDPNTASLADLERLGLRSKAAQTILNYRNKGGKFRQASDLRKIYTLSPTDAERLIPYVRITSVPHHQSIPYGKYESTPHINKRPNTIDINTASEADFEQLPGIGKVLAARIVKFRNAKQGFQQIEEVAQTYGLTEPTFQQIKPYLTISQQATIATNKQPQQHLTVNINEAGWQQLQQHCSTINSDIASAIITLRKKYGSIQNSSDLKRIVFLTEAQIQAIANCFNLP